MCNEKNKQNTKETKQDYRFLEYRLNQLENNLREGQLRLEREYKESNKQILETLLVLQDNSNDLNKTIIGLKERQQVVEQKIQCIDRLREVATKHNASIHEIERRMEIYKQILFVVGTGVAIALLTEIVKII